MAMGLVCAKHTHSTCLAKALNCMQGWGGVVWGLGWLGLGGGKLRCVGLECVCVCVCVRACVCVRGWVGLAQEPKSLQSPSPQQGGVQWGVVCALMRRPHVGIGSWNLDWAGGSGDVAWPQNFRTKA